MAVIERDPDLVTKYGVYERNLRLSRNANIRWCPQPQCQQTAVVLDASDPCFRRKIECESCSVAFCAECSQKWHEEESCQQALSRRVRPCPSCSAGLVKTQRTNHMACHCRFEFCWICNAQWTANHYAAWNVCGCPGSECKEDAVSSVYWMRMRSTAMMTAVVCGPYLIARSLIRRLAKCAVKSQPQPV